MQHFDEVIISSSIIDKHAASRNYVSRKKVVFFHEINAQIKPSYQNDMSVVVLVVVRAWMKKTSLQLRLLVDRSDLELGIVALY